MTIRPQGYPWHDGTEQLGHRRREKIIEKTRKPLRTGPGLRIQETSGGTLITAEPQAVAELRCRWFRVLLDHEVEALGLPGEEDNDLKCRTHICNGQSVADDAPSVWGMWEEVTDCTWYPVPQGEPATLVYFPQYRALCVTQQEPPPEGKDRCQGGAADPECRKNKHIFACWSEPAQRWEAVNDVEDCVTQADVAHVVTCATAVGCLRFPGLEGCCCLFDGQKINFWPDMQSANPNYCPPEKERELVWLLCANGMLELPEGFCTLGVKICDKWKCKIRVPDENGQLTIEVEHERPVYLMECGPCVVCQCPNQDPDPGATGTPTHDPYVEMRIRFRNTDSPCAYMDGIERRMFCLEEEPFQPPGAPVPGAGLSGWYAHFTVEGVTPRLLYHVTPWDQTLYPEGVWLEIACGGEAWADGTIIRAWQEDSVTGELEEVGIPANTNPPNRPPGAPNLIYEEGINDCQPLYDSQGLTMVRPRTYNYGIWAACDPATPGSGLPYIRLYLLKHDLQLRTASASETCDGRGDRQIIADVDQVISDQLETQPLTPCCDNFQVVRVNGLAFGCNADPVPIPDLDGVASGSAECTPCNHPGGGHIFGGCPCDHIIPAAAGAACDIGPLDCVDTLWPQVDNRHRCCDNPGNWFEIEFQWPEVQF